MNDDLQPLKSRVRWLNRGILILGVLVLLGVAAGAFFGLRKPDVGTTSAVVHPASAVPPATVATTSTASAAASAPKPAMRTAERERAAAAAVNALSAASAPGVTGSAPAEHPAAIASVPEAASAAMSAAAKPSTHAAPATTPASGTQVAAPKAQHAAKPAKAKEPRHTAPVASPASRHAEATVAPKPRAAGGRADEVGVCRTAGWYLQVGAFAQQASVDKLAARLHSAGYAEICLAPERPRGLRLFYVGPYHNAGEARAARLRLRELTGAEGILRKFAG